MTSGPLVKAMSTKEKHSTISRETCGSYAGYQAHQKRNEVSCVMCVDANTVRLRVWRIATGRIKSLNIPISVLRAAFEAEDPMDPIIEFLGEDVSEAVIQCPHGMVSQDSPQRTD